MIGLFAIGGMAVAGSVLDTDSLRKDRDSANLDAIRKALTERGDMRKFLLQRGLQADDSVLARMGV